MLFNLDISFASNSLIIKYIINNGYVIRKLVKFTIQLFLFKLQWLKSYNNFDD